MLPGGGTCDPRGRWTLTPEDGRDQRRQEAPGVDRHVEDGEELLPLFDLGVKKGQSEGSAGGQRAGAAGRSPLTFSSSNWSPPKAETQGLIPPVPKAMRISPTMERALRRTTPVNVRNVDARTQIFRVAYMWTSVFPTVGMAPTDLTTWPMT